MFPRYNVLQFTIGKARSRRASLYREIDREELPEAEKKIVSTHELPAPYGCRSVATKGGHFRARIKCGVWCVVWCGIQT